MSSIEYAGCSHDLSKFLFMQNMDRIHVQASSFWDNPLYQGEGSLVPRLIWPQEHHGPWGPRASDNPPPRKQSSQLGEIIPHKHTNNTDSNIFEKYDSKKKIKEFSLLPRQNPRWHFNPVSLAHRGFTLFPWYKIPISHERAPANSRICSSKRSRSSQSNTGFEAWFLLKFSYFQAQIADLVRVLIFYCFNKWRFPEIGLPLHYPLSFRIFP